MVDIYDPKVLFLSPPYCGSQVRQAIPQICEWMSLQAGHTSNCNVLSTILYHIYVEFHTGRTIKQNTWYQQ